MNSADPNLASLHALVGGRVQGVNFRFFVWQHASGLGLTGYVQNLPDGGTIEVRAEGEKERLEKLIQYLYRGPLGARIEKVEVNWEDYKGEFSNFKLNFF
jgi:acylphosphatase